MLIGRVVGEVVATRKHASHEDRKILLVQPENLDGSKRGNVIVALDAVQAGMGDQVLVTLEGFSAMTSVGRTNAPIDGAVVGIVDEIDLLAPPGDGGTSGSSPS